MSLNRLPPPLQNVNFIWQGRGEGELTGHGSCFATDGGVTVPMAVCRGGP